MSRNKKQISLFIDLLMLAVFTVASVGCHSSSKAAKEKDSAEVHSGPILVNMTARIYNGNDLQSIVQAERGHVNLNTKEGSLHKTAVTLYDSGKQTGKVVGDTGILFLADIDLPDTKADKDDIILRGHVLYTDKDGGTMSVPEIRYYSRTGKLISSGDKFEKRMKINEDDYLLTGSHFETNKDLTNFTAYGPRLTTSANKNQSAQEPKK